MPTDRRAAAGSEPEFPLGTAISLADAAGHRTALARRSAKAAPHERKSGEALAVVEPPARGVIHRAQQPDGIEPAAVPPVEQTPALSWQEAQKRLERVGASHYRLETWGEKGQFRFTCSVPLEPQSRINRHFEARASDPLLAIERVLDAIEHGHQTR
jgi:hypothetical protein